MRILICGICPLPFENVKKNFGPGVRTWQFAKALQQAGHDVRVFARRIPFTYNPGIPKESSFETEGVEITSVDWPLADKLEPLRRAYERFAPDGLVGATIYGSFDACRLDVSVPVWADQFGLAMAEGQAKSFIAQDNRYVRHFWEMVRRVMIRADVFSSVSNYQRYAMVGELGALGRLVRENVGHEFVHTIPCGLDPKLLVHRHVVLRGVNVPEDAFVVLWSGGYNVWADVDILFEGLEKAMKENPALHFVSTGAQIDGHDETTYPHFVDLVEQSQYRNRYVLLGWRLKEEVTDYYFEADVGVSLDRHFYEGMFGSKNRILDWMRAGLPALSSGLSELHELLEREGIGFTIPMGDSNALADALLDLAADPARVRAVGKRAQAYGKERLSFSATAAPLVEWAAGPTHAPDFSSQRAFDPTADLAAAHAAVSLTPTQRLYATLKPYLDRLGLTRFRWWLRVPRERRSKWVSR